MRLRHEMGANGARAVGVAAAQAKLHALAKIFGRPVGVAIGGNGGEGGFERSIRIGRTPPDVTEIEVGVNICKAGPHLAAIEIDLTGGDGARRCGDRGDAPGGNFDIDGDQVFAVGDQFGRWVGHERARRAGVSQGLGWLRHDCSPFNPGFAGSKSAQRAILRPHPPPPPHPTPLPKRVESESLVMGKGSKWLYDSPSDLISIS